MPCPMLNITLNGIGFKCLINTGSEINVITKSIAKKSRIPRTLKPRIGITTLGRKVEFLGLLEDAQLSLGGIAIKIYVFVLEGNY